MAQRTILVKSTPEGPIQKESLADEALMPGQLVQYASSTSIQVQGAVEGDAAQQEVMRVVREFGTITVDSTYAVGDLVPFIVPRPGDEVYAYATHAAGGTIDFGATLVCDGAGFLMDTGGTAIGTKAVLARAMEEKVLAANAVGQLKVEVL